MPPLKFYKGISSGQGSWAKAHANCTHLGNCCANSSRTVPHFALARVIFNSLAIPRAEAGTSEAAVAMQHATTCSNVVFEISYKDSRHVLRNRVEHMRKHQEPLITSILSGKKCKMRSPAIKGNKKRDKLGQEGRHTHTGRQGRQGLGKADIPSNTRTHVGRQ